MCSPRLFAREVTGAERQQLTDAVRYSKSAAIARRCQTVLMSRQGLCPMEIAKFCSASCSGVREIINLFNRGGFVALADKPQRGRPRKTDDRYVALLKQAVQSDPREMGYVFGCWTLQRLREHLAQDPRHHQYWALGAADGGEQDCLPSAQARHDALARPQGIQ
jgi:transposase